MREEMIAIIEGSPIPGRWAGIITNKYPRWMDASTGEIDEITRMRGVCPQCNEYHSFNKTRKGKWQCLSCKKHFREEEIVNKTIQHVIDERGSSEGEDTKVLYCLFCCKASLFKRIDKDKFQCSRCGGIVLDRDARILNWAWKWEIEFV